MNHYTFRSQSLWFLFVAILLAMPVQAFAGAGPLAYVGPGAGLGMIPALLAVLGVILLGLLAPILYPLMLLRRWLRSRRNHLAGKPCCASQPESVLVTAQAEL